MNRLHPQIGELVRHVIIGAPHRHHPLRIDDAWIGRAEMELLMNDCFARFRYHGDARKGHLAVAAIKGCHQPFATETVSGNNGQFPRQIDAPEGLA